MHQPNRVLVAYSTCMEAARLAPLVMELRRALWLDPVVAVPRGRDPVLDEFHMMLQIWPEIDLNTLGDGSPLGEMINRAFDGRSASFERGSAYLLAKGIEVVAVEGAGATAFAVALASVHAKLPVVHLEAGVRTQAGEPTSTTGHLGRLISQIVSVHLVPTPAERENLLREGIDLTDIVITGRLGDGDAAMRARTAIEDLVGVGPRFPDLIPPRVA